MSIPFVDLKAQYRSIKGEIDETIAEVLEATSFIKGPRLQQFEEAFAATCGTSHAIGTSSGTTALFIALEALALRAGDEVILPSHTFIATAEAVVQAGATVVLADIDPETYLIDPDSVARCLSERTRAILPVHLYGQMADMEALLEAARSGSGEVAVIEDAAQAHAARQGERISGGTGVMGCFSFYPGKNLGAYGDAGAVTTDDPEIALKIRKLVDHGRLTKYEHDLIGYNYRMDTLQAAVLSVKLRHLEAWNDARRSRATLYDRLLAEVPGVRTPGVLEGNRHVYHLYVIEVEDPEGLRRHLGERDIASGIHYPVPLHQQPAFRTLDFRSDDLPHTERLARRIVSLPMFPELTGDQVHRVVDAVREFAVG